MTDDAARVAQLEAELRRRDERDAAAQAEIDALREQQTVTAEVLRVIASAPTELRAVVDAVLESALRLSGSTRGFIATRDADSLQVIASTGDASGGSLHHPGLVLPLALRRTYAGCG
jgi:hypothetical protein